jgi:hypothetical protein
MSMLKRAAAKCSRRSAISGIGSRPPISAVRTSTYVVSTMLPTLEVTRSSTLSWKAKSCPSLVACTSVSR